MELYYFIGFASRAGSVSGGGGSHAAPAPASVRRRPESRCLRSRNTAAVSPEDLGVCTLNFPVFAPKLTTGCAASDFVPA